ncbi:SDR family oxidoreductase [Pseudonocardia sp. H11422]|uniref:SDR family oxidoreductase n=1 Tax=Pseudonocardia sp. H11422 TaxID=2835866 RepID=UPI001BDC5E6A|nr:SDR family oxidoreductase [Pseudonocardia sp. H11422]
MANTVLIAGASGLVGAATVDKFLDDGWEVIAVSRRRPEVFSDKPFQHLPVDLQDQAACRDAVSELSQVTHVVYTAVYEKPGLIAGWTEQDQMDTNLAMLRNLIEPLADVADLEHVSLLQGTKAYGIHLHPMPVPARERFPRDDHANFYWLQEDYIKEKSAAKGFDFTIFRPQLIVGPNTGVVMNLPPVIGVYAAICKEEGRPFGFPGGIPYVWEAVDCRLVAGAIRWAAEAPAAAGQHFNLTNGEVFAWRDLWPAFAEELGVELGPDEPVSLGEYLPSKADVWDKIVAKHGLRQNSITDILGESHYYADFCMAYGAEEPPPPAFVSTVKIKQAGFTETWDTEESFRHWLRVLIERRILPPAK